MNLIDSKSILAKLMATENLTVEQRSVSTASFDVKNRVLTVPILDNKISSELYDLFMGHEVGHALYTPLDGLIKAKESEIVMSIINVVEDARIERKIKYRYPGLKNSFLKAYKELNERDFFETKNKNLNYLNFIDRINLHFKCGVNFGIKFNDEEKILVKEVDSTETFDDVIDVSKKIIDYMKKEKEEIKKLRESGPEDGEDYFDDYRNYDELEYDENGEPIISNSDDSDEYEQEGDEEEKYSKYSSKMEDDIRSFTDEAYRKNESQLFADKGTSYQYVNIPKVDLSKAILDYKVLYKKYVDDNYGCDRKEFIDYRRESNKVVSYLVKEFEMRKNAEQMKRASVSKTGELDLNKVFSYRFNEDIFKKITVVPGGKSHGLVMFLDWSGSMVGHIGNTVKQLFNLVFFCKKVNIPFEVYAFISDSDNGYNYVPNKKSGDLVINDFFLANILSSRMNASEFTTAGGALMHMSGLGTSIYVGNTPSWLKMYGTPLHESIICAMEIVPEFQKKYKLQIVNTVFLTDGEGGYLGDYFDGEYIRDSRSNSSGKRNTDIILVDPVTKNQEKYKNHYGCSWEQMNCLIRLLKKRTNSHVIGFYVTSSREFIQNINRFFENVRNSGEYDRIKTEFRKNKFMVVTSTGFDDYYILRSNSMNTEEDAEFVVKENVTRRGLVSAFSKYTNARVNNRVVLNRFIGLIS